MLLATVRPAIAVSCTALVAAMLLTAGCGRSPVDPTAPASDAAAPADPGDTPADPGDGGGGYVPVPGTGGTVPSTGGGAAPASGGGSSGGGSKPTTAGHNGFKPLPAVTPVPSLKIVAPAASDPGNVNDFSSLLESYGYQSPDNSPANVKSQLLPILRTPIDHPERLHWGDQANLQAKWAFHTQTNVASGNESWPQGITFQQWLDQGYALAKRTQSASYFVARTSLYHSILADRYHDVRDDHLLIFYKRLNNTAFAVSFTADGTIDDFSAYNKITIAGNRELFLEMPAVFYQ